MKKIIGCLLASFFAVTLQAQSMKPVNKTQQAEIVAKIATVSSSIRSLQCDFVQTKHLSILNDRFISTGKMCYRQPNLLRWEYLSPYTYIFVLNGTNVLIETGGKKDVIDAKSSRLFQEITKMMMSSVTGQCLVDTSDFDVQMYMEDEAWIAVLTPLKRDIKQMFRSIKLYFNSRLSTVSHVEMQEASGDVTQIELKNPQLNQPIDEALFTVD
jgi:outer membrane lipoprotein carrier protein